jgi:hypothetical protein
LSPRVVHEQLGAHAVIRGRKVNQVVNHREVRWETAFAAGVDVVHREHAVDKLPKLGAVRAVICPEVQNVVQRDEVARQGVGYARIQVQGQGSVRQRR